MDLLPLLPAGSPAHRLESYLALDSVIDELHRGKLVDMQDAPRISLLTRLPLLSIRSALARLERHVRQHPDGELGITS